MNQRPYPKTASSKSKTNTGGSLQFRGNVALGNINAALSKLEQEIEQVQRPASEMQQLRQQHQKGKVSSTKRNSTPPVKFESPTAMTSEDNNNNNNNNVKKANLTSDTKNILSRIDEFDLFAKKGGENTTTSGKKTAKSSSSSEVKLPVRSAKIPEGQQQLQAALAAVGTNNPTLMTGSKIQVRKNVSHSNAGVKFLFPSPPPPSSKVNNYTSEISNSQVSSEVIQHVSSCIPSSKSIMSEAGRGGERPPIMQQQQQQKSAVTGSTSSSSAFSQYLQQKPSEQAPPQQQVLQTRSPVVRNYATKTNNNDFGLEREKTGNMSMMASCGTGSEDPIPTDAPAMSDSVMQQYHQPKITLLTKNSTTVPSPSPSSIVTRFDRHQQQNSPKKLASSVIMTTMGGEGEEMNTSEQPHHGSVVRRIVGQQQQKNMMIVDTNPPPPSSNNNERGSEKHKILKVDCGVGDNEEQHFEGRGISHDNPSENSPSPNKVRPPSASMGCQTATGKEDDGVQHQNNQKGKKMLLNPSFLQGIENGTKFVYFDHLLEEMIRQQEEAV